MFASLSSSSMFRPSIFRVRVAELSTLSATTTIETMDVPTVNSASESAAGIGEANGGNDSSIREGNTISSGEAKRLMRLVNVKATKLGMEGKELICYSELLEACKSAGVARTDSEASSFAQVLDEAGVILLFRDKVYLNPDKSNMGEKNHTIVMPDASVDATLNALAAAGFGAAGQKCMALSTMVFVGDSKTWEDKLVEREQALKVNAGTEADTDLPKPN